MSMTHGSNGGKGSEEAPPPRPPSQQSSGSGSGSSKHVKCIGRYVLTGKTLGKGNFARVEAAVHTLTRAKVAIKIIETDKIKEEYVRKNLLREAQLMRRLHHPNIIRLYETMKTNNLYCLVTEIADGGELLSYVRNDFKERRLPEATTRPFIRQLVSALYHLHSTGVVHRDLKMENILLDKKKRNIKIVDFGLSNSTKPGALLQTHCGSPEYAAPELFIPGREYGPEVDVWSLGVNLYAMLVGKLPFRSPRQGTRRRQKLLEQISNGLSEYHEKEMAHITSGARDLIGRILQPDPRRRVHLNEVMQHPWVTKSGEQPLVPYQEQPVDHVTKSNVIDLMSSVLQVSPSEIKDAVKRDRCDWLAAVYNLLIEQPEGRNIIQQLITDDPEDQLVDAAHYQGSMEHFRLSQADSLDAPEVASTLTRSRAQAQRTGYRQSLSQTYPPENSDYSSSTLPLTKREKKHHHTQDNRPLGAPPRTLNPLHPPTGLMAGRRASIASPYNSPEHQTIYQPSRDPILSHYYHPVEKKHAGRRLPTTPMEEPYHHSSQEPPRPHSRAESMPDPLPPPWRHNIAPIVQLSKTVRTPPSDKSPQLNSSHEKSKPQFREPIVAPFTHQKSAKRKTLKPIRPKSSALESKPLSGSVDANLHLRASDPHTRSVMWPPQVVPAPIDGHTVGIGWSSANNVHRSRHTLSHNKDIRALMVERSGPSSAYSSIQDIPQEVSQLQDNGSIVSVDIQQELFKPRHQNGTISSHPHVSSKENVKAEMEHRRHRQEVSKPHLANHRVLSGENLKVDPISGGDLMHNHGHPRQLQSRSMSAKPFQPTPSGYTGGHRQEMSSSTGYMSSDHIYHHQSNAGDLHYENEQEKSSKNDGHKSGSLGKTFKSKNSRERSASTTLH